LQGAKQFAVFSVANFLTVSTVLVLVQLNSIPARQPLLHRGLIVHRLSSRLARRACRIV
jgi:hypothetical protein